MKKRSSRSSFQKPFLFVLVFSILLNIYLVYEEDIHSFFKRFNENENVPRGKEVILPKTISSSNVSNVSNVSSDVVSPTRIPTNVPTSPPQQLIIPTSSPQQPSITVMPTMAPQILESTIKDVNQLPSMISTEEIVDMSNLPQMMEFVHTTEPNRSIRFVFSMNELTFDGRKGAYLNLAPRSDGSFESYLFVDGHIYVWKYDVASNMGILVDKKNGYDLICLYHRKMIK